MKTQSNPFTYILLLFAIISMHIACEPVTEKIDDSYLGYQYYPIAIGNEWTYRLDSFLYSNQGIYRDTASWYVKEKITEKHEIGSEENNFVLERSKSKDNINWTVSDIWTIKKTNSNIQKTEENHTFIKLIFPPKINKTWDGNAFIDPTDTVTVFGENFLMFGDWSYKIEEKIDQLTIESNVYSDIIKVREVADSNAINRRKSYAYYAKNIGLIKEERSILFDQSNDNTDWLIKADYGFFVRRKLISYKTN